MVNFPTIHLNGTSKDVLAEQAQAAVDALREALDALTGAEPNCRDYVFCANFPAAQAEHVARLRAIEQVLAEMTEVRDSILDQVR